jgi:ABC-2 type transport system permease protein
MRSRYGFGEAARMEWIKLRSLRSVMWTLALGMALTVALGVVAGLSTRSVTGDPTSNVLAGIILAQLMIGVLGVVVMTGEYSSGLIRVTLAAVPRRPLVLFAKAAVLGMVCLVLGEATVFASFLAGIAALRPSVPHPALNEPTVLRAVTMTGAYLALVALMGLGLGAIVRHSAAAVAALLGALFVLPLIVTHAFGRTAGELMPIYISGNSLVAVKPVPGFTWSPWLELGIVALHSAVLLAVGCWQLTRLDT